MPGNIKPMWKAVKVTKDVNSDSLPKTMYEKGVEVNRALLS
jgi:hypothetical protein